MHFIIYLVLLVSLEPSPTFLILDNFTTMEDCQTTVKNLAKHTGLTAEQKARINCLAVVTNFKDSI